MNIKSSLQTPFKRLSFIAGGLALVLGASVLMGWVFDVVRLKSLWIGFATMKGNTALCFVLAGTSLCLITLVDLGRWRLTTVRLCALLILLISTISLAEDVFHINAGIDQLLFRDLASIRAPGRMSPATAVNWIAVGTALLLIGRDRKRWHALAQWPALLVCVAALVALAGYLYSVRQLYSFTPYATVAFHTAIGFLIVAIGLLFVPPHGSLVSLLHSQRLGGTAARLLLPVVIALPLIGGWIRLEAQRKGWVGTDLGTGLFATGLVVMLVCIVWATARAIEFIDVKRQRAVDSLRHSEARVRNIFERVSDAFVALDKDWRYTYVNTRAAEIFGRKPEDLIGKHIWTEFPEGVGQKFKREYERAMAEQKPIVFEEYYPPYERWFENRVYPSSEGLTIYFTDTTERKRAEAEVRHERDFSEAILDSLPGVFYCYDENWRFRRWNNNFEKVTGYTTEEVARMSPLDFFADDEKRLVQARIEEVFAVGYSAVEADFLLKDGTRIPYYFTGVANNIEGRPHLVGVGIDISARKQAEEDLRLSEERLRLAAEAANVGLWDWDLKTNQVYYSQEWKSQIGYRDDEISNDFSEWQSRLHPTDLESTLSKVQGYLADPQGRYEVEFRFRHKDGSYRWIYAHADVLRDANGEPVRMLGCHIDITERKHSEEELRQAHDRLAKLVTTTPGIVCSFRLKPDGSASFPYGAERLEELFGIAPGTLGVDVSALFRQSHPDDIGRVQEMIDESARTLTPWRCEWRVHNPIRGEEIWLEGHSMPLRESDGCTLWHGVVTDITARKQAEAELIATTEQLRALSLRLLTAREEEGLRIAREIHDELGGALTGLMWDLERIDKTLVSSPDSKAAEARQRIPEMTHLIEATINTVRRISSDLRPGVLDDLGLVAAIEWQAQQFEERTGITTQCESIGDVSLSRDRAIAVFRIFQEILTNVLRHAQANRVTVRMYSEDSSFLMEVLDDGRGIDSADLRDMSSLGLLGMRERAHLIGGTLNIKGMNGKGTLVAVSVPME